jgi:hypothetical protein
MSLYPWKKYIKILATFEFFSKLHKVNNHPIGEKFAQYGHPDPTLTF